MIFGRARWLNLSINMTTFDDAARLATAILNRSLRTVDNELNVVQTNEIRVMHELDVIALCEYVIRQQHDLKE